MGMYEIDTYNDESDPSPDIDMLQFFKQVLKKKKKTRFSTFEGWLK